MPGPVSDSYDPEFSTASRCTEVREAIEWVVAEITGRFGPAPNDINEVVNGGPGKLSSIRFSERELRIIRYGLNRAVESL